MALYAYDECELPIYAGDAEERRPYKCCGCKKTVRVRKGPRRIPHFYHLRLSPSCQLYGKSQDHLFAQLALQKILPAGETILEKPFPAINRIGDLVWEPRKIIFEIQCSNITSFETERRIHDYLTAGYQVVWILDDRIFNRRIVRPAEKGMRQTTCYFATIRGLQFPIFYDQFEIFCREKRVKKGQRLKIQINKPCSMPEISWDKEVIPKQVLQKTSRQPFYFQGDLLHKALLSYAVPSLAASMRNIRSIELFYAVDAPKEGLMAWLLARCLWEPLGRLMHMLQETNERWG